MKKIDNKLIIEQEVVTCFSRIFFLADDRLIELLVLCKFFLVIHEFIFLGVYCLFSCFFLIKSFLIFLESLNHRLLYFYFFFSRVTVGYDFHARFDSIQVMSLCLLTYLQLYFFLVFYELGCYYSQYDQIEYLNHFHSQASAIYLLNNVGFLESLLFLEAIILFSQKHFQNLETIIKFFSEPQLILIFSRLKVQILVSAEASV